MLHFHVLVLALLPAVGLTQDPVEPSIGRYRVDSKVSVVGFDGTSTLHDFTGRSRGASGELFFSPDRIAATAGGQVWIEAKTLDTRNEKRDKKLRSTLEVEAFPHIRFTIDGVTGTIDGRQGELEATGRFDIHGVSRRRVVPLKITPDGEHGIRVRGESRFDISDHGVDTPSVLFVSMHDEVRAWLDVTLLPFGGPVASADSHALSVRESRIDDTGESSAPEERRERLWHTPAGLLWERADESEWIVVRDDTTWLVDMRRALRTAAPPTSETPPEPALRIDRDGGHVSIGLDGVVWVELTGLEGEAPFAGALCLLPDLPPAVRRSLRDVRGIPREVRVRTRQGAGRLEIQVGPAEAGQLPGWALAPADWTEPAEPLATETAQAR